MSEAFTGSKTLPMSSVQRVLEDVRLYCALCFRRDKSLRTANTIVAGTAVCWEHVTTPPVEDLEDNAAVYLGS